MDHQLARCKTRIGASVLIIALCAFVGAASAQGRFGSRGITVYMGPDFNGESATFRVDTPDLRSYGFNDKISSVEVPDGEAWEVCQDIDYGNRCQVISGSVSELRSMGWNDRISSLRRVASGFGGFGGRRSGGVSSSRTSQSSLLFYDRTGFRGSSTLINSANADLSFVGRPGSVDVRGGGAWELCDRSGRCVTITDSVSDLSQLGLSNRMRSATLLDDRGNVRGRRQGGYRRP